MYCKYILLTAYGVIKNKFFPCIISPKRFPPGRGQFSFRPQVKRWSVRKSFSRPIPLYLIQTSMMWFYEIKEDSEEHH